MEIKSAPLVFRGSWARLWLIQLATASAVLSGQGRLGKQRLLWKMPLHDLILALTLQ